MFSLLSAGQQIVTQNGRTYLVHTIAKGEGLYRISVNYGVTQQEIIDANPQLKYGLREGETLKIPYSNAPQQAQQLPNPTTSYITHTVEKGQTAYSISKRYGVPLATFYAVNPACEAGLTAGMQVRIPVARNVQTTYFRTHVIAAGETLYGIGIKYGVRADEIVAANKALDVSSLPVGTVIRIPETVLPTEDDAFVYHRIQKGETLFALCNRYDLLQDKIKECNPGIDWNALSVGQIIAIPKKAQAPEQPQLTHEVGKRETLFGISQQYGVSIADICRANPGLDSLGLRKGDVLRIPQPQPAATPATQQPQFIGLGELTGVLPGGTYRYEDTYPEIKVGLMLPFNSKRELARMRTEPDAIDVNSRMYLEFYQGVLLAVDSLKRADTRISLKVYDTNDASFNMFRLLNQPDVAELDLIIGPAGLDAMRKVADFAVSNRIATVFPFETMDSTLLDNPYLYQASRIDSMSHADYAEALAADLAGRHVVLLTSGSQNAFERNRAAAITARCAAAGISVSTLRFDIEAADALLTHLSPDADNVVVIPSNEEARVNSMLVAIAGLLTDEVRFTVTGQSDWLSFQTIEVDVFHKTGTVVYTPYALDSRNPQVERVLAKHRAWYFTEPVAFNPYFHKVRPTSGYSRFGLWGYDVAYYFISAIRSHGRDFDRYLAQEHPLQLQSNLRFRHLSNWGGSYNCGLRRVTFAPDYTIRVDDLR